MSIVGAALGVADKGLLLAQKILDRQLPSEAKELKELSLKRIDLKDAIWREKQKLDPNDAFIQNAYQQLKVTNEKIEVLQSAAAAQLDIILSKHSN